MKQTALKNQLVSIQAMEEATFLNNKKRRRTYNKLFIRKSIKYKEKLNKIYNQGNQVFLLAIYFLCNFFPF